MKRRTFDVLASMVGLGLAAVLIIAGSLLTWAHNFVQDQVHSQLVARRSSSRRTAIRNSRTRRSPPSASTPASS